MTLPVYNNNKNLKAAGVELEYTPEQIQEYIKCANDPTYFIETYGKIVSLDKGVVPFILYPYQKRIIEAFHENRKIIAKVGRQLGKCVYKNTFIKVRNKTTGEIKTMRICDFFELQK